MEAYHEPGRRARMLGSSERSRWLRVDDVIREKAGVRPGMVCVDLGCGAGVFSVPLAAAVGETGKVYAVDTSSEALNVIREKEPPPNLIIVQADAADTKIEGGIADLCLMVLFLHEVSPEGILTEAFRLLKPEGRALVLEWKKDMDSPMPPRNERIGREQIKQLLEDAGFTSFEYTDWSDSHYVATAAKPAG